MILLPCSGFLLGILLLSCGLDTSTDVPVPVKKLDPQAMDARVGSNSLRKNPPGIHESSGFFPVALEEKPLGFVVVGDMGGPVLYSSSTTPAWLVGNSAYMIGPDGSLSVIALDGSSNLYLPPDLEVFASTTRNLPTSVSVTGPASAVYLLDDHRLMGLMDGTHSVLRQFGTEFAGSVSLSGSPMEIVIADSNGRILALDGTGSTILWESAGGPVLLSGGMATFIGVDSHLQIIEALDGHFVANSDLGGFSASIKPSRDETSIFAALQNGNLVSLEPSGKTIWIAETGLQSFWIMNDLSKVYAVSQDFLVAFDKVNGAELWRLTLPVPPSGHPVMLPGSVVFAGTNGKVYASEPDSGLSAQRAADPGERVSAVIGFRLEKYVRNRTELLATFLPFVDQVPHEGPNAFTIFSYGPVETGGEYWFTWEGLDRDVVLALFNERGDELRANLDEFGAHDSFSYRLDEGGRYFVALGRQDPLSNDEPLFLSVIPARRN